MKSEESSLGLRVGRRVFQLLLLSPIGVALAGCLWYANRNYFPALGVVATLIFLLPLLHPRLRSKVGSVYFGMFLVVTPVAWYLLETYWSYERVLPIGMVELATLNVNGWVPVVYDDKGLYSQLLVLPEECGTARFALRDGLVVDSRIDVVGDIGLKVPMNSLPGDGGFLGLSLNAALQEMQSFYEVPLADVREGSAWLRDDLVVYQDREFAVFGERVLQNTSEFGRVGGPFEERLRNRMAPYQGAYFHDDHRQDGRVYVRVVDDMIVRIWAIYEI